MPSVRPGGMQWNHNQPSPERLKRHGFGPSDLFTLIELQQENDYWDATAKFVHGVLALREPHELTVAQMQWRDKILRDLTEGVDRGHLVSYADPGDDDWIGR